MNGVMIKHGDMEFSGSQVKGTNIIQEHDPLSVSLIESVADFTIYSPDGTQYEFDKDEPFLIFHNDNIKAVGFADSIEQVNKKTWNIKTSDFIHKLDEHEFEGDVYAEKNASELLSEIMAKADIPYFVDSALDEYTVSGLIPYTNCREALAHLMFAVGLVINPTPTYIDGVVYMTFEFYETSTEAYEISKSRTLTGGKIVSDTAYTGVELKVHEYEQKASTAPKSYWKAPYYTGENVVVSPDVPVYDWDFVRGSTNTTWEILSQNANFTKFNYVALNADEEPTRYFFLEAKPYSVDTAVVGQYWATKDNIVAIENKTLVHPDYYKDVLSRSADYYKKNKKAVVRIVEGKHEAQTTGAIYGQSKYGEAVYGAGPTQRAVTYDTPVYVGMLVTVHTDNQGTYTGRIVKQQYNLNGNIIIKEITVK